MNYDVHKCVLFDSLLDVAVRLMWIKFYSLDNKGETLLYEDKNRRVEKEDERGRKRDC